MQLVLAYSTVEHVERKIFEQKRASVYTFTISEDDN